MHFGAGGTVNTWPLRTSHLTAGISKDAQIFQANFFMSSMPDMAVSSSHQLGVSNWQAHHSSNFSYFLIDGSGKKLCLSLVPQPVLGISKKHSNSDLRVGGRPKLPSSTSPLVAYPQGPPWGLS